MSGQMKRVLTVFVALIVGLVLCPGKMGHVPGRPLGKVIGVVEEMNFIFRHEHVRMLAQHIAHPACAALLRADNEEIG